MNISRHLVSLLQEHDCVIVPGFGGFICDYSASEIDRQRNVIYPPSRKVAFNASLNRNDGLLASYVASAEKIGYAEAARQIREFAAGCLEVLESRKQLVIDEVGQMHFDRQKNIHFKPDRNKNFLADSFGLMPVALRPVMAGRMMAKTTPVLRTLRPAGARPAGRITREWIPIAALLALMLMVPALLPRFHSLFTSLSPVQVRSFGAQEDGNVNQVAAAADTDNWFVRDVSEAFITDTVTVTAGAPDQVQPVGTSMEPATAPSVEISQENAPVRQADNRYFIIAGCFGVRENAIRFAEELRMLGFPAEEAGINAAGLTLVSASSHATQLEAEEALARVRGEVISSAWIFRKKS